MCIFLCWFQSRLLTIAYKYTWHLVKQLAYCGWQNMATCDVFFFRFIFLLLLLAHIGSRAFACSIWIFVYGLDSGYLWGQCWNTIANLLRVCVCACVNIQQSTRPMLHVWRHLCALDISTVIVSSCDKLTQLNNVVEWEWIKRLAQCACNLQHQTKNTIES